MTMNLSVLRRAAAACLVLSLWLAPAAVAQGFGNPEMMKQRLTDQMEDTIKQLALTDVQDAQARPILLGGIDKRMETMADRPQDRTPESQRAFRARLAQVDEDTETQLAEVLTPEQLDKYKQIQQERAAQRGRRGGPPGGPGRDT